MTSPLRDGNDAMATLLAKAKAGAELLRPGAQARVWRSLERPPKRSAAWWLIPVVAVAGLAAFVVFGARPAPAPAEAFATVTLASGDVQSSNGSTWATAKVGSKLTDGAQLRVADRSRAYTRLDQAGALFREGTRARLSRQQLRLEDGAIVAAAKAPLRATADAYVVDVDAAVFMLETAADTVTVHVTEGQAHVTGPRTDVIVRAGESWSNKGGKGRAEIAPADVATARALQAAQSDEAVVRIAKPLGAKVSLDGVELGTAPLEVVARAGTHEVLAVQGSLRSTLKATVGGPTTLEVPEAKPLPLPDVSFEKDEEPAEAPPELHPAKVQPPADPSKRYLLARSLAQKGRYAEAVGIYEGLAKGDSGWAEPSQYEVGRLQLRGLKSAARALEALDAYRQRYPNGSLAHEVALTTIEVQLKLGAGDAALHAMDDFLTRFPSSERRADVRFVRATVRRDRGDCAGAAADYLLLLDDPAHADDALYFAAACEQQTGEEAAARRHLTEYLKRFPAGSHRDEVRRFFRRCSVVGKFTATMNTNSCRLAALAAVVLCCACNPTQMVGSRYVKSQQVTASQGGTLTVAASDSPELAGTELVIEPGALSQDTEITLELGDSSITQGNDKSAGSVAIFGPSGTTFSKPVHLRLPYTLQQGETVDRLFVQVQEEDGTRFVVDRSLVTVDEQNHQLKLDVRGFTGFQPGTNTPCMANNDCAQGQVCVNGVCKSPGCTNTMNNQCQCNSNSECATGQVCSNGLCQACTGNTCAGSCSSINQCPMGQTCLNGSCSVCNAMTCNSSCASNTDCPNGTVCLAGVCQATACGMNAACPANEVCTNGVCVPAQNGCGAMGVTCASGQVCLNGQCTATMGQCGPNAPCPQGQTCTANGTCSSCNAMNGCPQCDASRPCTMGQVCVNGACTSCANGACGVCMSNTDCPSGQACVNAHCQATMSQCGPNAPCPMGQVCSAAGQCQSSNACGMNQSCPSGTTCVNGVCTGTAQCNTSMQCASGQQCVNGQCVGGGNDAGSGCGMNGVQCGSGQTCVNGQCVSSGCGGAMCTNGQVCVNNQCVAAGDAGTNQCNSNMQCGSGQTCVNGQCRSSGSDGGVSDGGSGAMDAGHPSDGGSGAGDGGTFCGAMGQTCTNGQICVNGSCQILQCANNTQCPMGYSCVQNICQ